MLSNIHQQTQTGTATAGRAVIANKSHGRDTGDRKSTRLNSSHITTSYAVFCLKKKNSPLKMAASIASRAVYSCSPHAHTIKSKPEVGSVVAIESELSTAFQEEGLATSLNISNQWS